MKKKYFKYKCPKCNGQMVATTKDYEKARACHDCGVLIKTKYYNESK